MLKGYLESKTAAMEVEAEVAISTAVKVICSSIDLVPQPFRFVASMARSYLALRSNHRGGIVRCLERLFWRYVVQSSISKSSLTLALAFLFTFDEAALPFMKERLLFHVFPRL
jgi:hypothetical protein